MEKIYDTLSLGLKGKLKNIKLIALDFDGVLTDNTVVHLENGLEGVVRSRADSLGVDLLNDNGLYDKVNYTSEDHEVDIIIMSRESNKVVKSVADKIKVKVINSLYEKKEAFRGEVERRGLDYSQVLFMGNDMNDIDCVNNAGVGVAVADSYPEILKVADYVTTRNGGRGAFREVCELILKAKLK
ncbi:MAG: HAD hydrolase family protein [Nanoarchaeota archaeon]|nr:HAD hydrolase family protein [Nanoarchaeota archaeon]